MNDIGGMISELLSSPDAQEKLAEAARQLGLGADGSGAPPSAPPEPDPAPPSDPVGMPDMSMLGSLLGGDGFGKLMPMLIKLMPLLSGEQKETDNTRLLCALEPFMSGERRTKLAEVRRLMGVLELVEHINE